MYSKQTLRFYDKYGKVMSLNIFIRKIEWDWHSSFNNLKKNKLVL